MKIHAGRFLMRMAIPVLLMPVLPGCGAGSGEVRMPDEYAFYFDIGDVLDRQEHLLDSVGTRVSKTVNYNGKKEKKTLKDPAWNKELKIFRQANINQPVYEGLFRKKRETDIKGADSIITFLPVENESPDVRMLKVRYKGGSVSRISAEMEVNNFVYSYKRWLNLDFVPDTAGQGSLLKEYYINNREKVIFLDSARYKVRGKIDYDQPL